MGIVVNRIMAGFLAIGIVISVILIVFPHKTYASSPSAWAQDYVEAAVAAGLVPARLRSNFTQAITRAEFSALAVALYENRRGIISGREIFSDTSDVHVQKAAYIGLVNGVGDNKFDPNGTLTREQAAVLVSRLAYAAGHPLSGNGAAFTDDSSISNWAREGVGHVQATGIMGGVGDNRFDPTGAYTREQSIVTILRLYELLLGTTGSESSNVAVNTPGAAMPIDLLAQVGDTTMVAQLNALIESLEWRIITDDTNNTETFMTVNRVPEFGQFYNVLIGINRALESSKGTVSVHANGQWIVMGEIVFVDLETDAATPPVPTGYLTVAGNANEFERRVLELTNAERVSAGLPALTMHTQLSAVARGHSMDMSQRGFFSHVCPSEITPFDRINKADITWRSASENIGSEQRTPEQVVREWMDSPSHRYNILDPNFTHIGIGFYNYMWTQKFIEMI